MSQTAVGERRGSRFLTDAEWRPAPQPAPSPTTWEPEPIFGSEMLPAPADEESVAYRVSADTHRRLQEPLARISALMALGSDWDSYGGQPIRPSAALHAVQLLAAVLSNDVPSPSIVPTSDGGLQLEWHQEEADLEMAVTPDRSVEVFLQMPNEQTWEGPLANNQWRLEAFLAYVAK